MIQVDSILCPKCDFTYDACLPECAYCKSMKYKQNLLNKLKLADQLISALPKCDSLNCKHPATRYELFDEYMHGVEFKTYVWRCDEHKFSNGLEIDELPYAEALRKYLK